MAISPELCIKHLYSSPKREWNRGRRGTAPVLGSGESLFTNQVGLL